MSITDPGDLRGTDPNAPEYNVPSGKIFPPQPSTGTTTIADSSTLIATFDVFGFNTLSVEAQITTQTLNAFEIWARMGTGATYQKLYSASADYTSPSGFLEFTNQFTTATGVTTADDDLTTTADLESAAFRMDVAAFDSVKIYASCGVTGGASATYGSAY